MVKKEISEWIGTANPLQNKNWLELFKYNTTKNPQKTALRFKGESVTYKDIDLLSNWFASEVLSLKSSSDFIGLCISRSPEMIAAMIGIHKSGKAYLPLDPAYPENRLQFMMRDSGMELLITDTPEKYNSKLKCIDSRLSSSLDQDLSITPSLDDRAYMLYTSGSTGQPKGVVINHRSLLNFLQSMKTEPGCTENDKVLALTTISFDIAGLEIFLPLFSGASIVLSDPLFLYDSGSFSKMINDEEVTMIQATPSIWKVILDSQIELSTVKKVLTGGEALTRSLADRLLDTGKKVWNMYGPTETTIWSSIEFVLPGKKDNPPLGKPIMNTGLHILKNDLTPVEKGESGQLWISGYGLAECYWNRPELNSKSFAVLPVDTDIRIYATGDLVFENKNGEIVFQGRSDQQVKIRGMRIDTGEIEEKMRDYPDIADSAVIVRTDIEGNKSLTGFFTEKSGYNIDWKDLQEFLRQQLPEHMVPGDYVKLEKIPTTLNNKKDYKTLSEYEKTGKKAADALLVDIGIKRLLINLWKKYLNVSVIDPSENFFDIGGHSLLVIRLTKELSELLEEELDPLFFFKHPTINSQYEYFEKKEIIEESSIPDKSEIPSSGENDDFSLAIIGISCELPGASNPEEFWRLLSQGQTGIRDLEDYELLESGVTPDAFNKPDYIKKTGSLESSKYFDYKFFGYSPKEARFMDPQHRKILEHSYKVFENAGIIPEKYDGKIGVFASCGQNQYLLKNIINSREKENWSDFQTLIGNENDFLATRIAYNFNLKGPALTVQTGCSSSLVAVQLAYQSLINYQCDMAICGGISLNLPLNQGYTYDEGSIFSPDGLCRAFDKEASGTIFGSGLGLILVKRLSDAKQDDDSIVAVIRSAAVNNDGSDKIGYTAPSISGQSDVILDALQLAEISPDDVSYIEAHGTGTRLGDPIEVAALNEAFRSGKSRKFPCYLGSVKTNIGHLDAAAGIVGLIKTALALQNKQIPPSLNYTDPNPEMKVEETPFEICTELMDWSSISDRLLAGVSSFGIGGTNAHVILESYESVNEKEPECESPYLIYPLSSHSIDSLNSQKKELLNYLKRADKKSKVNAAYTLTTGRKRFAFNSYIVSDLNNNIDYSGLLETLTTHENPTSIILFPGQAILDYSLIKKRNHEDLLFSKNLEKSLKILDEITDWNSRELLKTNPVNTEFLQPLLFCVEWASGQTLIDYNVPCEYLIGHSLGEFVAATLSGAIDLETAIGVIVERGRIMSDSPGGNMLVAATAESELIKYINDDISIAAENSPEQCVISGKTDKIIKVKELLESKGVISKILNDKYAFHHIGLYESSKVFKKYLDSITFNPIEIPIFSNLTGEILEKGYLYTSEYWADHMIRTVQFKKSVENIKKIHSPVFIEAGPGNILSKLVRSNFSGIEIQTIPFFTSETEISVIASLIACGMPVDTPYINKISNCRRIALPPYPFQKTEAWIEPDTPFRLDSSANNSNKVKTEVDALRQIWINLLGYKTINDTDNFFYLGGDSLTAAKLVNEVNKIFNLNLSLRDIFLISDFKNMAKLIEAKSSESSSFTLMFPIQKQGTKRPLFLVAGAHENRYYDVKNRRSSYEEDFLRYFSSLIGFLGADQPVYGFRPRGIFYGERMHSSVKKMAEEFINLMKTVQPKGPYIIGGECVGGSVAIEMAKLLAEKGEKVSNLLLMDTPRPGFSRYISEEILVNLRKIKRDLFKNGNFPILLRLSIKLIKGLIYFINIYIVGMLNKKSTIRVRESSLYYQRKLLSYKPIKYSGKVDLIVNSHWNKKWPDLKWNTKVFPQLKVHEVPGDHKTRLSEYGHICGKIILEILDENDYKNG